MSEKDQRRKEARDWVKQIAEGDVGAGYQFVADRCQVVRKRAEQWVIYGFPPHQLRRLREIGEEKGIPFPEDLIAWPEDAEDAENGAAA